MNIQWYPGHMTKAKRAMKEDIKLIDLIIELVDARVPLSSRNPDIDVLGQGKARLILLNKSDLAAESANEAWAQWFAAKGYHVVKVNSKSGAGLKQINAAVAEACKEKIERDRKRGILNRPVRAMVVGIPNVGKSTFINSFAGKACAKTGNRPGVTKGNQWIRLNKSLELLDTPGILWPKFEDQQVGLRLAFIGSINDEILQKEELAAELIRFLNQRYPGAISRRYPLEEKAAGQAEAIKAETELTGNSHAAEETETAKMAEAAEMSVRPSGGEPRPGTDPSAPYEVLGQIAKARACLLKGGEPDLLKAANILLDDFRSGRLGRITLEFPEPC